MPKKHRRAFLKPEQVFDDTQKAQKKQSALGNLTILSVLCKQTSAHLCCPAGTRYQGLPAVGRARDMGEGVSRGLWIPEASRGRAAGCPPWGALQLWSQSSGSGRILMHPSIQQDISEDMLCASLRVRRGTPRDVRQPREPRGCFVSAVRAPMAAYELLVQVVFTARG